MRYWFDTEYFDDQQSVHLISIGIVAEDGRELYAVNKDFDWQHANEWLKQNVKPRLLIGVDQAIVGTRQEIADEIKYFIGQGWYGRPEFWGYFVAYDWVVFCQLFGGMLSLPPDWPQFAFDLTQFYAMAPYGCPVPRKPVEAEDVHNALADARWTKESWERVNNFLLGIQSPLAQAID